MTAQLKWYANTHEKEKFIAQYLLEFHSLNMFWFVLLVLAVWILYKLLTRHHDHFAMLGVPYEVPVPFFGNVASSTFQRESFVDQLTRDYEKFKKSRVYGFFNFSQNAFVLTDPELVKRVTIKDFDHFVNHNELFVDVDTLFGKSLFGMLNQKWRDMRATLSPIFTSSKMKSMFGLLTIHVKDFIVHFDKKAGNGTVDIDAMEIFSRFTADGIATAVLGFEGDCVKNDDSGLLKLAHGMIHEFTSFQAMVKFIFGATMPKIYNFFGIQLCSNTTYDFFKRVVIDVMNERERTNISRPDVIQLMLNVRQGKIKDEEVNEKEIEGFAVQQASVVKSNIKSIQAFVDDDEYWMAQGFIFFFGGFDTTSNLLQSVTFELAVNPDIQNELYTEISDVIDTLNGKPVTYEVLHKMKFLDMVVSEALRKHPPFPQMDRTCTKDYELDLGNGKIIPIRKGEIVLLPYYQLHRDHEYWPNPEKFDPYRFSDENKDSIVSGTYLPFGLGPRACIGSRFVMMEAKLLLFNLLAKFEIKKCARTPEKLTYQKSLSQRIQERVLLNFKRR